MKLSIKISRIVTCISMLLYTLCACYHVVQTVHLECLIIMPLGEEYVMRFDRITPTAWFYIISGVLLLGMCVATVIFLFRRGLISSVLAGAITVISAIYGMCLDTFLSEFTLWREVVRVMGMYSLDIVCLSIKNVLAMLSIAAAVCYVVLCLVARRKNN